MLDAEVGGLRVQNLFSTLELGDTSCHEVSICFCFCLGSPDMMLPVVNLTGFRITFGHACEKLSWLG